MSRTGGRETEDGGWWRVVWAFVIFLTAGVVSLPIALADAPAVAGAPTISSAACRIPPAPIHSPTPEATEEIPPGVPPTPTPEPDAEAIVDPLLAPQVAASAANFQDCWNAGEWPAVVNIVTPRFLESALGIAAPDDAGQAEALDALGLGPLRIETVGPVTLWSDGRGAVDVFYRRGQGRPAQAIAARWFFVAERGVARFDEEALLPPPPLGDRVTIGFAIPDDEQPLQWASLNGGQLPASPVISLHGVNRGRQAHTFLLTNAADHVVGLLTLPPWTQGDMVLLDLPPATYQLRDPAVERSSLSLEVGN